jgi:predicted nucleic acid-binding protein
MISYADAGFLVSLYSNDANSSRVVQRMMSQPLPISISWLCIIETRNALRLRQFRKQITSLEQQASLSDFESDLALGVLRLETMAEHRLQPQWEFLSDRYSATLGTRTLDILHVAAAVVLGAQEFLTFDHRQAALARAAGLIVPTL